MPVWGCGVKSCNESEGLESYFDGLEGPWGRVK